MRRKKTLELVELMGTAIWLVVSEPDNVILMEALNRELNLGETFW